MKQKLSIGPVLLQVTGFTFVIYFLRICWYLCEVIFPGFVLLLVLYFWLY